MHKIHLLFTSAIESFAAFFLYSTRSKYGTGDDGQTTTIASTTRVFHRAGKTNIALAGNYVCVIGVCALTLPTAS